MPVEGPTLVRRQLGRQLRHLRTTTGMTALDVKAAGIMAQSKLRRIEIGETTVKPGDARELCRLYGADESTTDHLAALAAGSAGQGWWQEYADVMNPGFALFIGLEEVANELHTYEAELVPGLLQTGNYTRGIGRAERPEWADSTVDRRVALRQERQRAVLGRERPPRITAVLNAAVLARPVGGPDVMAEQIQHLLNLSTLDHVTIRVLPWSAGAHAAMSGSFTIYDFDDQADPPTVHADTHTGARYVEQSRQVNGYRRVFALTCQNTIPIEEYQT